MMTKTITQYFIERDFIGYPVGIIQGEYTSQGTKIDGDFKTPSRITPKKILSFNSIQEIRYYEMCKCGKPDCKVNKILKDIVDEKMGGMN